MFHAYNKCRYFISVACMRIKRDISFHAIQHFLIHTRRLLLHRAHTYVHIHVIQMRDLTRHQNPGFSASIEMADGI